MSIATFKGASTRSVVVMAVAIGAVAAGFAAAPAQADPLGDYSQVYVPKARTNGPAYGVTAGPGGNMWYTRYWTNRIGRIAPSGAVREFQFPGGGTSSA